MNQLYKSFILLLAIITTQANAQSEWTTVRNNSAGHYKFMRHFNNGLDIYTIYEGIWPEVDKLLKSTDNGSTWTVLDSIIPAKNDLHFTDAQNGWMTTSDISLSVTSVYKTTDGGNTWTLIRSKNNYDDYKHIDGSGNFICIAGGNSTGYNILFSTDGGTTWDSTSGSLSPRSPLCLDVVNSNTAFIGGSGKLLMKTTNAGTTWDTTTTALNESINGNINTIHFINDNEGWLCFKMGASTNTHKTTDGGQSWTKMGSFSSTSDTKIYFVNSNDGYVAGTSVFHKTTDGAATWNAMTWTNESGMNLNPAGVKFHDISFFGTEGFAGVEKRILAHGFASSIIEKDLQHESVSVYPNPFSSSATIVIASEAKQSQSSYDLQFTVYDLLGNAVKQFNNLVPNNSGKQFTIDRKGLASGLYFYRIQNDKQILATGKLIIQ